MHSLALINQKGGCGKTTTAINLSAGLAERGHKVLLVDMDPQAHATLGLGVNPDFLIESMSDAFSTPGKEIRDIAMPISERLDLAPSKFSLALIDRLVADRPEKHRSLRRAIESCASVYDFAVVDCPPNVGALTLNALAACNEAMAVLETSFFSLHGISRLLETLAAVRKTLNPGISVSVVATMYDKRTKFARDVLDEIRTHFGVKLYSSIIRTCVRLREAASAGLPIQAYDPRSRGSVDYSALAAEVIERSLKTREAGRSTDLSGGLTTEPGARARDLERAPESYPAPETYLPPETEKLPAGEELQDVTGATADGIDSQHTDKPERAPGHVQRGTDILPGRSSREESSDEAAAMKIVAGEPVRADGHVLFTLHAPNATDVRLVGDFNGWDPAATPMTRADNPGVWTAQLELHDGRYEYRYLVDGEWMEDPENPFFVIDEYGSKNSVIVLGEAEDIETGVPEQETSEPETNADQPQAPYVT